MSHNPIVDSLINLDIDLLNKSFLDVVLTNDKEENANSFISGIINSLRTDGLSSLVMTEENSCQCHEEEIVYAFYTPLDNKLVVKLMLFEDSIIKNKLEIVTCTNTKTMFTEDNSVPF